MKEKAVSVLESASKLMDVKSLTTIALTIGFIVMAVRGTLVNEYTSVYLVVISFYFGTQHQKAVDNNANSVDSGE